MGGIVNWKKASIPAGNPDADHVYVGVDTADDMLYVKDDGGTTTKFPTTAQVTTEVSDAIADHVAELDPHTQYLTAAEGNAAYDATGAAAAAQAHAIQRANHTGTQTASTISDFNEAAQDAVGGILTDSSTIDFTYNDAGNTITAAVIPGGISHTGLTNIGTNTHAQIDTHIANTSNPHSVTKSQVGLANADNTSDANKPVSTAQQTALDLKANLAGGNTFSGTQTLSGAATIATSLAINGVSVAASALLQIDSTSKGILIPRMAYNQREAISSPATGLAVYDNNYQEIMTYNGSAWLGGLYLTTTTTQTSTSATYSNNSELQTLTMPGGKYLVEFYGICQCTSTTVGIGVRVGIITTTASSMAIDWQISEAADGTDKNFQYTQISTSTNVTSSGALAANTDFPVEGRGVLTLDGDGKITIQLRTETGGTGVSIRSGCVLFVRRVPG